MSYQVPQDIDPNKIFLVNFSRLEGRMDPEQYHQERISAINQIKKAEKYMPLSSVASFITTTTTAINEGDIYVGLENITSEYGEFVEAIEKQSISSASIFKKGDVLFPKLRPYLNKVFYASFDGICSTEFYVLKSNIVSAEYLAIFLRSSLVVNQTKHLMTGNTLPRLQTDDVKGLLIPIPSTIIQQRVVDYYNYVCNKKNQKEKHAQAILNDIDDYLLRELGLKFPKPKLQTLQNRMFVINRNSTNKRIDPYYYTQYFRDAFGVLESCRYPVTNLKNISELITSGITPKAGGDAYTEDKEIGVPFVRSGNISIDGEFNYDDLLYLKPEVHNKVMRASKLKKDVILIAIVGATIGQVGIYLDDGEANINQAIALVRLKDGNDAQFIKELLKSSIGQLSLNRLKRPVARANINLEEISTIKVVLPPLAKQQEMANHIKAIRQQAKALQEEGRSLLEQAKKEVEQMIIG